MTPKTRKRFKICMGVVAVSIVIMLISEVINVVNNDQAFDFVNIGLWFAVFAVMCFTLMADKEKDEK